MLSLEIARMAAGNVAPRKPSSEIRLRLDSLKHLLENDEGDRMPLARRTRCF